MTVDAIKEAISRLPDDELHALAAWLTELDYGDWDREMVTDFSACGRGTMLVDAIKREVCEGKAVPSAPQASVPGIHRSLKNHGLRSFRKKLLPHPAHLTLRPEILRA